MFVSLASPLHKACCTLLGIFSRLHPRKIWKESTVLKQIYHLWKCEERGWLGGWRWGGVGVISQPIKCKRRAGESRQGICSLSLVWLPTEPRKKAQEDFQISPPSGKRKPSQGFPALRAWLEKPQILNKEIFCMIQSEGYKTRLKIIPEMR